MEPKDIVEISETEAVIVEESTSNTPDSEAELSLEEQLAAKEKEARENWDRFLRERADLENYRKRVGREKEELLNSIQKREKGLDDILDGLNKLFISRSKSILPD